MGRITATWSISWKASIPRNTRGLEPPMATRGAASTKALATPVTRLVVPGPEHPMHTPGRRVRREYAWAIRAAACSCRVSMARTPSLIRAVSVSIMGPPMMKKRVSVPCSVSARASRSDPVDVVIALPPSRVSIVSGRRRSPGAGAIRPPVQDHMRSAAISGPATVPSPLWGEGEGEGRAPAGPMCSCGARPSPPPSPYEGEGDLAAGLRTQATGNRGRGRRGNGAGASGCARRGPRWCRRDAGGCRPPGGRAPASG